MNCVRVFAGALAVAAVSATLGLTTPADARTTKDAVTTAAGAPSTVKIVRDGITLVHQRTPVGGHTLTGQGPTRSDFDGDGRDDLAVTNGQGVVVAYSSAPIRDYLTTELPAAVPMGCTCLGRDIVTGNFNGDKYDDLVVANFDEADLKVKATFAGAVWIILGGPGGLRVDQVTHVNQSTSGVSGTSAASDAFGSTLAAGDVTGDGMDELLIGIPNKKVGGKKEAGAVVVLKGSSTGTVTSGAQWLDQSTPGVPGAPEYRDHFGQSIAVGKLNKNKYRDVVIGAPWEDDGKQFWGGSGVVTQFWGSSAGVSLKKITTVSGHATAPIAKPQEIVLWYFGTSLVIADTTGDGTGEVIVGSAHAQVNVTRNIITNAGVVASLTVRSTGMSVKGMILLSQRDKNIAGGVEDNDSFGRSLAAGDITGDGIADVLVSVSEDVGKVMEAGSVVLLRGSPKGLTGAKSQTLSQSSAGVPGSPEADDYFGSGMAVLNLDGAGGLDAAIGAPGEMIPGDPEFFPSGTVTTMFGTGKGLGNGVDISGRSLGVPGEGYGFLAHQ